MSSIAIPVVAETMEEENARLKRDNEWLTRQIAAAEKALSQKHLALPTDEEDDGDDPDYFYHAGLIAKYCAALRKNSELTDNNAELCAHLYKKNIAAGVGFVTLTESAAADKILLFDRRIRELKTALQRSVGELEVYKVAHERQYETIDALKKRITELEEGM